MIEAYQIAANLVMDPKKVTGPIAEVIKALEDLTRVQRDVQSGINEMGSGIRASRNAAAGLVTQMQQAASQAREFARAMQSAGRGGGGGSSQAPYILPAGARQGPSTPPPPSGPGSALIPSSMGGRGFAGGARTGLRSVGGGGALVPFGAGFQNEPNLIPPRVLQRPSESDLLIAGVAAQQLGSEGLGRIGAIFDAGIEAQATIAQMQAARFTAAQIDQSKALARILVGKVPGLTYGQGLDLINQTTSFTGDVGEALKLTPGLAFNAQVLSLFGKRDAIAQVESAVKAGELTGLSNKDGTINTAKLTEFVNRLTSVVVSGGGTLDINKYLTGLKQFGLGATAASMDFSTAVLPAYMKIMGEQKAGTALASLQQSMLSPSPNTRSKAITEEQIRIGLRDKKGNVINADLLQSNPFDYTTQFLLPLLENKGINDPAKIKQEIFKLFSRQTVDRLVGAGIFDESVINKEANRNRAQIAAGTAPLDALLNNSTLNQVNAFTASLNLLKVTLADPNMGNATGALRGVTGAMLGFSEFLKNHPVIAALAVPADATADAILKYGGAAVISGIVAKNVFKTGKAAAGLFSKNTILPGESDLAAVDGSTIAGRWLSSLALGPIGRILGPLALGVAFKDATKDMLFGGNVAFSGKSQTGFIGPGGKDEGGGLIGLVSMLKDLIIGQAKATERPIQVTFNVDGRKVAAAMFKPGAGGTQGGMTQFDPSMGLFPAGLPAGGGN